MKRIKSYLKSDKEVRQKTKLILQKCGKDLTCVEFYRELKFFFPKAVAYYDGNHITVMVNGRLYDKTGLRNYPLKDEPMKYNNLDDWKP